MNHSSKVSHSILSLPCSFVVGFLVFYLRSALQITTVVRVPDVVDKLMVLTGSIILLYHCISHLDSFKGRYIFLIASLFVGLLCYVRSGQSAPFIVILIALSAGTVDNIDDVVRLWFGCTVALILPLVLLFLFELIFDPQGIASVTRSLDDGTFQVRYAFYFYHPNMFGAIVLMACSSFVYLNQNRLKFGNYVFIICVAFFVFFFSGSRTSSALTVLLAVLSALQKTKGVFSGRRIRTVIGLLPLLLFAAVLLVSGPLYSDSLGNLLTGRVSLWNACFSNQGISLFGQEFVSTTQVVNGWIYHYTTLDCAYASGLYVLGVAFSLWFAWAVWKSAIFEAYEPGRILPALFIMLLFGITEVHIFSLSICYILLLLGKPLLRNTANKGGHNNDLRTHRHSHPM